MKIAFNAPLRNLNYMLLGDMFLCLPQYFDFEPYVEFLREHNYFKILDNGAAEGERVDADRLLECAKLINANEIIIPDVMLDAEKTIKLLKEFMSTVSEREKYEYSWMAVIQGKTPEEWINCYKTYINTQEIYRFVNTFGVPKSVAETFKEITGKTSISENRPHALTQLLLRDNMFFIRQFHLLGLGHPSELPMLPRRVVRSVDTSLPFLFGKQRKQLKFHTRDTRDWKQRLDYKIEITGHEEHYSILWNIAIIRHYAAKY